MLKVFSSHTCTKAGLLVKWTWILGSPTNVGEHVLEESYSLLCVTGSGNLQLALLLSCIWWDGLWEVLTSMWSRATPIALALIWFWVDSFLMTQADNPAHHRSRHSTCAEERSDLPVISPKQPLVSQSCCSRFALWLSNWGGGEGDERVDSKI